MNRDLTDVGGGLRRWLVRHQWADLLVALLVGVLAFVVIPTYGIPELGPSARRALFQSTAGMALTLLGLTMATIGILASSIDKPLALSPGGLSPDLVRGLSRPMFGLLRALGAAILLSLFLVVVDREGTSHSWAQPALLAVVVTGAIRVTRVLSLLSHLLKARAT